MQTKFNSLQAAEEYLFNNKYKQQDRFLVKNDKAYIYKHRNKKKYIHLSSKVEYIDSDTMDRGVVWTMEAF